MPGTRKLGRKTAHRMSMLRGLVTYLLENEKLETTYTRAKEVSALAEKMITLAKTSEDNLAAYRTALSFVTKKEVARKLFHTLGARYADVNGGYTQIYKLGPRRGDGAEMAIIRLTPVAAPAQETEEK